MDWKGTKIATPKIRGGELSIHMDPFKQADRMAKRCVAMDKEQILRNAFHVALDEALDDAEPEEEDKNAELDSRSEQRKQGGGCGKSYACDSGRLISQKSADKFRRLGLNYAVF
jgi:hypothetical protein